MTILFTAIGGGLGAMLRYILDTILKERARMHPALSILIINALGSLVLGFTAAAIFAAPAVVTLPIIGICGGFTTFSTASLDTYKLLQQRALALALTHAIGQLAICAALAFAGFFIANRM